MNFCLDLDLKYENRIYFGSVFARPKMKPKIELTPLLAKTLILPKKYYGFEEHEYKNAAKKTYEPVRWEVESVVVVAKPFFNKVFLNIPTLRRPKSPKPRGD